MRPAPLLVLACVTPLLASCAAAAVPARSTETQTLTITLTMTPQPPPRTAAPSDAAPEVRFDGRLDGVDGHRMKVRCVGEGAPTILLEGGGTDAGLWAFSADVERVLGAKTTVCHYGHPGADGSPPVVHPRALETVTGDAWAILDQLRAAGAVDPPYLYVGSSLGGSVAISEALLRPADTAGVVLLDTDAPVDFLSVCPASGRTETDCRTEYEDDIDAKQLEREMAAVLVSAPWPVVLVSSTAVDPACTEGAEVCRAAADDHVMAQRAGWAILGPNLRFAATPAGHDDMPRTADDPGIDAILALVEELRH